MRRVALGSGLELAKLASTIRQIAVSDPPLPVLVCQAESNPDAWVHLSLSAPLPDDLPAPDADWTMILGYPLHEDALAAFAKRHVTLPLSSEFVSCERGLQATIRIPFAAPPDLIANLIQQIMAAIQQVDPAAPVELALEYP